MVFKEKLNFRDCTYDKVLQFSKFGLVGIINNAVYYIVYLILLYFNMFYMFANIIGFSVSVLNSFYWNNHYVFTEQKGKKMWWKIFLKTYIVYASTGIILSNFLLALWIEVFSLSKIMSPILNLIVTVPINFILNKYWAYK